MAKSVGVVSKVIGEVVAVQVDGTRRVLIEGDRLFAGEQLETGAGGAVAVQLDNGALLTLGRDSSVEMTAELLSHQAPSIDTPDPLPSEAELTDVLRLQRAITAGADPTLEAQAPAAGGPRPLGGGHDFVLLTEVGARVEPEVGFPTAGFSYLPEPGGREFGGRDASSRYRDGVPTSPPTGPGTEPPAQPPTGPGTEPPAQPPTDHPVTLRGLDVGPAEAVLDEANLAQGSASDAAALTQRGTFTVVAPDGVYSLSVGGLNVVTAGVVTGVGQSLTSPLGNTLTITGYNAQTGEVSYSYTLNGAEQHPEGSGRNALGEQFAVQVRDTDGDTASGTLDVLIRDDVPTAVNDLNATSATELHTQLTGSVLVNDIQGADRVSDGKPIVAGVFAGTYGTLILAGDGSYTYTLDANGQAFKQLHGGAQGTEVFTYTLRDADGDTSTATLTLNINNLDDPVVLRGLDVQGGELTVFERYLNDGSTPDPTALTQAGTFTVSAPDGLQALKVGGIDVVSGGVAADFPQTITTGLGNTLTITGYDPGTGVVSYRYTLQDNAAHPTAAGANSLQEQFSVVAQDSDGSTATGTLDVNIVDDLPEARADAEHVREGGIVSGNVLLNDTVGADVRADGHYVVGVRAGSDTSTSAMGNVGTQVQGQYGVLTLAADGSATYHANPNSVGAAGGRDVFVYTIRDADGDESTTTVTLDVRDSGLVACPDFDVTVYEKALDLVRDGNDLAPGTVVGSDPGSRGETGTGTLVGAVTGAAGGLTYSLVGNATGQYGQIAINPDGTYTYTLTSAPKSPGSPNNGPDVQSETFTYQAVDANGNSVTGSIVVRIVDDVPKAHCDYEHVREGGTVSGNVLLNDMVGADVRADGHYVVGVRAGSDTSTSAMGNVGTQVQGQYGVLTLAADGSATYHANPNSVGAAGGRDVFVYTIRDADGDESTTTVTLNVKDSGLAACQDWDVKVYEKALDLNKDGNDLAPGTVIGSDPGSRGETGTGTLVGAVSGGTGELTYSLVGNTTGQYGQIAINPDGTYTYTLTSVPKTPGSPNNGPDTQTETFTYQATDANGNTVQNTLVIRIVDDVPKAHCDYEHVREGGTVSGNVLLNDMVGADVRADGHYVVGVRAGSDTSTSAMGNVGTQVQGQYGVLTLAADGNATYHANPNSVGASGGRDVFVYTIRDADGDESTTTVTLNVKDSGPVPCTPWFGKPSVLTLDRPDLVKSVARSEFVSSAGSLSAVLVVAGLLSTADVHASPDSQSFTLALQQGERLTVQHTAVDGGLSVAWQDDAGSAHGLAENGQFTAPHDGLYSLHLSGLSASDAPAAQGYPLSLVIDHPQATVDPQHPLSTPADHPDTATVATTATAHAVHVDAAQPPAGGETLVATDGNVLLDGSSGDGLLISGQGSDTASYADARHGVVAGLQPNGSPDAAGGRADTLHGIQNLIGSAYDDQLFGNAHDNLLVGGRGNDQLTGGGGHDTFAWGRGEQGRDTVTDFKPGQDHLDLSQLLQGEGANATSLDDYLHFKVSGEGATLATTLDVTGPSDAAPSQSIELAGVDLAQHYGIAPGAGGVIASGHDTTALINAMLGDQSLRVDNV
ncbi:retention module-containing protein [Pseudomonas sp. RP23018S]|nr:retention module-containing protein [Pseudomonas sp. RP23018S]MDZ5601401.1 retention module-containing protein [Pseudomonas sp. RP23018S]